MNCAACNKPATLSYRGTSYCAKCFDQVMVSKGIDEERTDTELKVIKDIKYGK